jgi:hypothetical protein
MAQPKRVFSTTIGEACTRKMVSFYDLAAALRMDVVEVMKQCNGKVPPSKTLVRGVAKQLGIDEAFLDRLADEVRKDLGQK